jgi:hypothetical protein
MYKLIFNVTINRIALLVLPGLKEVASKKQSEREREKLKQPDNA